MSKKPEDQPEDLKQAESAAGETQRPTSDGTPPQGRHSPTPREDAEWEHRMDELEVERYELHKSEVLQPATIDPQELTNIVKRLEALKATSKKLGQEKTRLNAHLEEALLHLNRAALELAEGRGRSRLSPSPGE